MNAKKAGKPATGRGADLGQSFAVNLMQHLVVPTFVLDAECNVLIWNKACERLTGVPAADVIGTREHWRAFYEEPRPCLADLVAQGHMDEVEALYVTHDDPAGLAFGVGTSLPQPEMTSANLIAAADAALYRAKHAGRNRWVADQTPEAEA